MVPNWNEKPNTLNAFEERVILLVLETKERGALSLRCKTLGKDGSRVVKSAVTTTQPGCRGRNDTGDCGSATCLGSSPNSRAVRFFRRLMGLRDMKRQPGDSMRKGTSHFEAFIWKTGKALYQADAEIRRSNSLTSFLIWSVAICHLLKIRPFWPRVEQRQRKLHSKQLSVC